MAEPISFSGFSGNGPSRAACSRKKSFGGSWIWTQDPGSWGNHYDQCTSNWKYFFVSAVARPSPLNLRATSHNEGPSPSPSPLWSGASSTISPSLWSLRNGPPPYSTPTGPSPARPDFYVSMASSRGHREHHFSFSQHSIASSGIGTEATAALSPTSPRLPPRKPVTGSGLDAFQGPRDNFERVNEWLQSPPSSSIPTELLMP